MEDSRDLHSKWPGLTKNLVRDVYGTHKALLFGAFKFQDYSALDFQKDIIKAESDIFGETICSDFAIDDAHICRLSLYPQWLIRDDLFEIFALQFAVSKLVENGHFGSDLTLHCVVIPQSVVSLYKHVSMTTTCLCWNWRK